MYIDPGALVSLLFPLISARKKIEFIVLIPALFILGGLIPLILGSRNYLLALPVTITAISVMFLNFEDREESIYIKNVEKLAKQREMRISEKKSMKKKVAVETEASVRSHMMGDARNVDREITRITGDINDMCIEIERNWK